MYICTKTKIKYFARILFHPAKDENEANPSCASSVYDNANSGCIFLNSHNPGSQVTV